MDFSANTSEKLLNTTLALMQYPILAARIRARMREELFSRNIIDPKTFENHVRENAIQSQRLEGLDNPYSEETTDLWENRLAILREHLTDLLFSRHLPFELLETLIKDVLDERGVSSSEMLFAINPELAPLDLVFEQAIAIEKLPEKERASYVARLEESKVVLIRTLISDQLRYINIAKEWLSIEDLAEIRRHKIGGGRIGGKSAGMILAQHILQNSNELSLVPCLSMPESYYVGSNEFYTFMSINNLLNWNDQKYKSEQEMREEYPAILQDFRMGSFPPNILDQLQTLLIRIGKQPLIVRSSSLLEDNFGTSFAGKYESVFCPNQGNLAQNLEALTRAIASIYASVLNPDALLYRRSKGLQDYDERMALLIQVVEGDRYNGYLMPHAAGVAFSRNLYRWAPHIRAEDGFVRLVWGLGTRAVDRVGNDFPRLIALSHPLLRPSNDAKAVRRYSQQFVDLIDLDHNLFTSLPIHDVLAADYPPLRYIAQVDKDGYFESLRSTIIDDPEKLVVTFDVLLQRTPFAERMRIILKALEQAYHSPVDVEFTTSIGDDPHGNPQLCITILQCRPQGQLIQTEVEKIPTSLPLEKLLFSTDFIVPQGRIAAVDWIIYVQPEAYFMLGSHSQRAKLARTIGRLNNLLKDESFICIGPGRWGSSNADLGVPIGYGDIYHAGALVELAGEHGGLPAEPSLGTHFFQDLLEAQIYPLALQMDNPATIFKREFFDQAENHLTEYLPDAAEFTHSLRLLRVGDAYPGQTMRIIMNDDVGRAVAFLVNK
ncbi:MAG: PEP/pyruvate-binding domain-containing protein [Anaerolineaceae bacterium]